jgi:hypothetical protein
MSRLPALLRTTGRCWPALLLASLCGCGMFEPEPVRVLRDVTKAANSLCDALQTVQDAPSAEANTSDIDKKAGKLLDLLKDLPSVVQRHKNTQIPKELADQVMQDWLESMQRFKSESERIGRLRGLPAGFWDVVTVKFVDMGVLCYEIAQSQGVDSISKEGADYLYHMRDLLTQHGRQKVVVVDFTNLPDGLVQAACNKLAAAADGAVVYHLGASNLHSAILGPVADFRAFVAKLDMGSVFSDEPRRKLEIQVDRRKLGARANSDAEEQQLAEAESRQRQEETRREWEKQAERNKDQFEHEARLNPNAPDYHEKLAERLASENVFHRREAIDALLRIERQDVKSADTRKMIARNFKQLALEQGGSHDRGKAVQGLARWGGKFSVPTLLDIFAEEHCWVKEDVFKALGELQDERAAAPVAARLGDFFDHQQAVRCLKRMGPVAEDAVVAVGASPDPKVCLGAIEVLSEIGTQKSVPFLRTAATQSRNPQVKVAAKAAIKTVIGRQRTKTEE